MTWYLWVKAAHVFSIIAWMAGLLYLPRLFVYHAQCQPGSAQSETFKVMERRLLRGIMNPAMILAWTFGLILLIWGGTVDWSEAWAWVKAASVVALTVLHHFYALWRKDFERDANTRSPRFYKFLNEAPALLALVIVAMVIVKPF